MKKTLIALLLLLVGLPSQAYFENGNDLVQLLREYEKWTRSDPNTDYVDAQGYSHYVIGIFDALYLTKRICAGGNTAKIQVNSIVGKFLNDNPARWSDPAYFLVADALKEAFPCKE